MPRGRKEEQKTRQGKGRDADQHFNASESRADFVSPAEHTQAGPDHGVRTHRGLHHVKIYCLIKAPTNCFCFV